MNKIFFRIALLVFLVVPTLTIAQSNYQQAVEHINKGEVDDAITSFETAVKKQENTANSLLYLAMLKTRANKDAEAAKYIKEYLKVSKNPYPALFALWEYDGVMGEAPKKTDFQLAFLEEILKRDPNQLIRPASYRTYTHYVFSNDFKEADKYTEKLKSVNQWSLVGPFDNVVNGGFNKNFGPLDKPELNETFTSKYGADIQWFVPKRWSRDGYYIKDANFFSYNSLIYAQTFVNSPSEQEVILSFSYSGSMKFWVNDQLVYTESERRETELDFYQYKLTLNQGFNRLLIQLGDYEEEYPNFSVRFLDLNQKVIELEHQPEPTDYQKTLKSKERLEHYAVEHFKNRLKEDPNDLLSKLLLAESYMRGVEVEEAENIYKGILEENPKNYFAILNMVLLYDETGNATGQNKFYGIFERNFPESYDILSNKLDDAYGRKAISEFEEIKDQLLEKYGTDYLEDYHNSRLMILKEDYMPYLDLIETMYKKYPDEYFVVNNKYEIEKEYYKDNSKAKSVLESYIKNNFQYEAIKELASLYLNNQEYDKAIKLFKTSSEYFEYDTQSMKYIVNLLSRQKKFKEAIAVCNQILERVPMEWSVTKDIGDLYLFMENKEKALEYYELTNEYFPFEFETNEKIRSLKGLTKAVDMIPEADIDAIIEDYEANMKVDQKMPYDIVYEKKSRILYKSTAGAKHHEYLIKVNDEDGLEKWQQLRFSSSSNFDTYINEVATIKPSGEKIAADRDGGEVVFTNLESGDYVYVNYSDFQTSGGKTSLFVSDNFNLTAYFPVFKREYNLFVEEGLAVYDTTVGDNNYRPEIIDKEGFKLYQWKVNMPETIKDEDYQPAYSDLTNRINYTVNQSWDEIVEWYSDLSSHQATADYTINSIVSDLFDGKEMSDEEKFKSIYEFVIDNIQYSSVDFRQSSYIPQKASNTYHSRLGDCKDLSTLFVSLARTAGLKANLVLINTDNSKNAVVQPSLNFDHCIVKTYSDEGNKYLELTSNNLPYGALYHYLEGAAILEIPFEKNGEAAKLEYLTPNKGFSSSIIRTAKVQVNDDGSMFFERTSLKTGVKAESMCNSYCNVDEKDLSDEFKGAVSSDFNSEVEMKHVNLGDLAPRKDSVKYDYSFVVSKDIIKLGSFRTFKIPYTDFLINMNAFKESDRKYSFNFPSYEVDSLYKETIEINLPEGRSFKEVPENMNINFNGTEYKAEFKLENSRKLTIVRSYKPNREVVELKDYDAFKSFAEKVTEAENMQLLFQ